MAEETAAAAETPTPGASSVTITFAPTIAELINASAALSRTGMFVNAFGGYTAAFAVYALVNGAPIPLLLPPVIFATACLTGYFTAPFIWFVAVRRRDLVLAPTTLTFDADGIQARTPTASGRQAWSVYRSARDIGSAVALDIGPGIASLIPKARLRPDEQAALDRVLREHGLVRPTTALEAMKPFLAIGLGAVVALVQINIGLFP